jgi:hypothetical protein
LIKFSPKFCPDSLTFLESPLERRLGKYDTRVKMRVLLVIKCPKRNCIERHVIEIVLFIKKNYISGKIILFLVIDVICNLNR